MAARKVLGFLISTPSHSATEQHIARFRRLRAITKARRIARCKYNKTFNAYVKACQKNFVPIQNESAMAYLNQFYYKTPHMMRSFAQWMQTTLDYYVYKWADTALVRDAIWFHQDYQDKTPSWNWFLEVNLDHCTLRRDMEQAWDTFWDSDFDDVTDIELDK